MNSMKRQKDRVLKEELARSVGARYATGDQWRNNSRNNEGMEPKQKQYPAVDVTGDKSNKGDGTQGLHNRLEQNHSTFQATNQFVFDVRE